MSRPRQPTSGKAPGPSSIVLSGRRRAGRAKATAAVLAAALFAGGLIVTRSSYASHMKQSARALAAPARFEQIVQHDTLGVVAPAQAPAEAQTSTS